MNEILKIPIEIGDYIVSWFSGEGVTVKKIVDIEQSKPIVLDKRGNRIPCSTNYMKVTEQMKINKKNYPEFMI